MMKPWPFLKYFRSLLLFQRFFFLFFFLFGQWQQFQLLGVVSPQNVKERSLQSINGMHA